MLMIEIDRMILLRLEESRLNETESYQDILKRELLTVQEEPSLCLGQSWHKCGVELPSGTHFRFTYKQKLYAGKIVDSHWVLNGKKYLTPNRMIKCLVPQTKSGKTAVINPWLSIMVKKPKVNEWVALNSLRKKISRRGKNKN